MSEHEMIIRLLKRVEKMLLQQTLLNKEVLNTKEAANYMGLSVSYLYKLRRKNNLKANRPSNGRLYFKRIDVYNWMLSIAAVSVTEQVTEQEKLSILNPEIG